jgi:hypothetical protein
MHERSPQSCIQEICGQGMPHSRLRSTKLLEEKSMDQQLKIGSKLKNNESGVIVTVTGVLPFKDSVLVEYINAVGNRCYIRRDRVHFDGKERKRDYNWISNPEVMVSKADGVFA